MFLRKNIFWELYAALYAGFIFKKSILFFHPESPMYLYFYILWHFDKLFFISYALAIIQLVLDAVHLVPLVAFIYHVRLISPRFWQYLLILRIIFDLSGNSYDWNQLISFYKMDFTTGIYVTLAWAMPCLPSYIANFLYAFRWKKFDSFVIRAKDFL